MHDGAMLAEPVAWARAHIRPTGPPELVRRRTWATTSRIPRGELAAYGLPATLQHDDLHHKNVFVDGDALRIIDWGDASRSHPFVSLVVTFRFLEERNGLAGGDPWLGRLRSAYLEPWGTGLEDALDLCLRVGRFVHAFGWAALRRLLPTEARAAHDVPFAIVLRRALAVV